MMTDVTKDLLKTVSATPITDAKLKYTLPKAESIEPLVLKLVNAVLFDYYCDLTDGSRAEACLERVLRAAETELVPVLKAVFAHRGTPLSEIKTREFCRRYLLKLSDVRKLIVTDVAAAFEGDPAAEDKDLVVATYPGVFAVVVYRLAHALTELNAPFLPRLMCEYAHGKTGVDIHPAARIGEYFFIDHGTGVVIGETTEIGKHVKVYKGVTFGALSTRGGQSLAGVKRHPTVGDNVTIYSDATILGGETVIGENATIGANAFITKSVPPNGKVSFKD